MKHSVEEITLKNGAKGLLIDIPGASVMSTRIQFRAGMMYAKNHYVYEIPHVVEHLAFERCQLQFPFRFLIEKE